MRMKSKAKPKDTAEGNCSQDNTTNPELRCTTLLKGKESCMPPTRQTNKKRVFQKTKDDKSRQMDIRRFLANPGEKVIPELPAQPHPEAPEF